MKYLHKNDEATRNLSRISQISWCCPSEKFKLKSDEVHIWITSLDRSDNDVKNMFLLLSEDECLRAKGYRFDRDRRRFILRHGVLRMILAGYLDIDPKQVSFCLNSYGKPFVERRSGHATLFFNLSKSNEVAVYAFSFNRRVGIDVEFVRPIPDADNIVGRFFSASEFMEFCTLPSEKRQKAFFDMWTCKEAFVKALGHGLLCHLNQFHVLQSHKKAAKLLGVDWNSKEAAHWSLDTFVPVPGYTAAVVAEDKKWELRYWQC